MAYDNANELTSTTAGGVTTTYAYDVLGRPFKGKMRSWALTDRIDISLGIRTSTHGLAQFTYADAEMAFQQA